MQLEYFNKRSHDKPGYRAEERRKTLPMVELEKLFSVNAEDFHRLLCLLSEFQPKLVLLNGLTTTVVRTSRRWRWSEIVLSPFLFVCFFFVVGFYGTDRRKKESTIVFGFHDRMGSGNLVTPSRVVTSVCLL